MRSRRRFICRSCVCAVVVLAGAVARASEPTTTIDQTSLLRASALFDAGRFVEAEAILRPALSAVDAGKLPASELGKCVGPLLQIYRTWGRYEDALKMAERQRAFLEQATFDRTIRDRLLRENRLQRIEILAALERFADAEALLQPLLDDPLKPAADPSARLALLVKSAQLADLAGDAAKARQRWLQAIDSGQSLLAEIARHEIPGTKLAEIAALTVTADAAVEDFAAAILIDRQLLANQTSARDWPAALKTRTEICTLQTQNHEYPAAQSGFMSLLADIQKKSDGSLDEADVLTRLAALLGAQGLSTDARKRWSEAAAIYKAALEQADRTYAAAPVIMSLLAQVEASEQQAGQFGPAIDAARRLLTLREQRLGKDHPLAVAVRSDLGALYGASENYTLARPLLLDAVAYWRRATPARPLQLARALNDLGVVERAVGSFGDAQALFDEALAIRQRHLRPDDLRLAYSLNNAASVRLAKGNYAAAVALFDQAIEIYRRRGRVAEELLSNALLNVAMAYKSQGQFAKAGQFCREALQIYERVFGADSPGAIAYYSALTALAIADDRLDEASETDTRAWSLCVKHHLDRDPVAATVLHHRATIAYRRGELDAAARDWQTALDIQTAAGQTAQIARTLNFLAKVESLRGHSAAAEKLYRQALERQQAIQAYPVVHYLTYCNLAEILHAEGKSAEATQLLDQAVKLVEAPRAGTLGAEEQRADYFAQFASAFDLLVTWSLQAGDFDRALEVAERGRNRTLLDQMGLAGVDLRDTLTGDAGQALVKREREAREKLGSLRGQMQAAAPADVERLAKQYTAAQDEFAAVWTDIRNASPFYREQLSRGQPVGSLAAVRQLMGRRGELLLLYYLGAKQSELLVIGDERAPVEVVPLEIPKALADGLHVGAGPLTRSVAVSLVGQYLADLRDRAGGRGLSGVVHSPKGVIASEQGTQLAEVLLPRAVRKRIQDRGPRQLTIVPDGALHQLPFESLLVEGGATPRYLLDVLPPIAYAPSATILMNLESRPSADPHVAASVLTVGNPHYPLAGEPTAKPALGATGSASASVTSPTSATGSASASAESTGKQAVAALSRDAYLELGGRLPPLPGTSIECGRVAAAFPPDRVTRLELDDATEANVRRQIAGRRYVHLAAHGLVDQQHSNLFGAIALTPGRAAASEDDDGFLSLHEIHALPLSGCELVVLSACQTNVGPDRPLEAGVSLAQAFLAAGSKRVICSHWNVDDASTAELMGAFFEGVAKAEKSAAPVNYALLLQEARKTVRSNPRWASPYYWAPFVLVGPGQ